MESEYHRVHAEILVTAGASHNEVEASLTRAIEVARSQNAKLSELRAATSLASLRMDQRERQQAGDLLAPIYGSFGEGFDTPDLMAAKTLLQELA